MMEPRIAEGAGCWVLEVLECLGRGSSSLETQSWMLEPRTWSLEQPRGPKLQPQALNNMKVGSSNLDTDS